MTYDDTGMYDVTSTTMVIHFANGTPVKSNKVVKFRVTCQDVMGKTHTVVMHNVLHIPAMSYNLFGLKSVIQHFKGEVILKQRGSSLKLGNVQILSVDVHKNKLWGLKLSCLDLPPIATNAICKMTMTHGHELLGHPGEDCIRIFQKFGKSL